jgi:transcription antitermination factor NusG
MVTIVDSRLEAPKLMQSFAPFWYAVRTLGRHEKTVAQHLTMRGIEHFLPLYVARQRWNQRTATVHLPLFPGYVFVHCERSQRYRALEVPGAVDFVGPRSVPQPIPEEELLPLMRAIADGRGVLPRPYLAVGKRVRVVSGPLTGLIGSIERLKTGDRFVISVDLLLRSVTIEIGGDQLAVEEHQASSIGSAARAA